MPTRRSAPRPELADARAAGLRNIGEAAAATGVSAKTIRHYERIGLLPEAGRSFAGYRLYADADLHRLRFIRRGRDLGFPIARIRDLLSLWDDRARSSAEVKRLAQGHIAELDTTLHQLQEMRDALSGLAERCHGDARPDCPILAGLAGDTGGDAAGGPASGPAGHPAAARAQVVD